MSKLSTELERAFQAAALRPTAQRYAVLEFLARHSVHATADEIFAAVNRHDPRASRATVYNSLHSLAKAGLVREVSSDGKAARYDANLHPHHHFICDACGNLEDVEWHEVPIPPPSAHDKRVVRECQLIFRGLCAKCAQRAVKSGHV